MQRSERLKAGLFMVLVAALALPFDANARTIRVDVGSGNYPTNGQAWESSETPLGAAAFLSGTLPFALNFGTGLQTSFCLGANGFIGFSGNCGAIPANATLQPLGATWITDPATTRIFEQGSVTYTEGNLARQLPFPANPLDAPLAVRFHWNDVICAPPSATCQGQMYSFQAILIDMGNGDFDLELNFDDIPAGIGIAQFLLGTNAFQFGGPFLSAQDYDFQFRGGVLVNGTPVPEPGLVWLLGLAAALMGLLRRRRS